MMQRSDYCARDATATRFAQGCTLAGLRNRINP
jgi:hypothetical protein